jgi:hypothetical protein
MRRPRQDLGCREIKKLKKKKGNAYVLEKGESKG